MVDQADASMDLVESQRSLWPDTETSPNHIIAQELDRAQLLQYADRAKLWHITESSAELSYLTHGFFRFYGKFPPRVAKRLISECSLPGDVILDPTVGSGTTLLEALDAGHPSIGSDINPLASLVSKVKVTPVDLSSLRTAFELLEAHFKQVKDHPPQEVLSGIPNFRNRDHWFFAETCEQLAIIRHYISHMVDDRDIQDFLKVVFASIIRKVSRASSGMGRIFFDPNLVPLDVMTIFRKRFERMLLTMGQVNDWLARKTAEFPTRVLCADARDLREIDSGTIGLVICHPPYFNLYKYSRVFMFEMYWLGYDYPGIRRKEIREAFKQGKSAKVREYVEDMSAVLAEMGRVLKKHRHCGLMIGDTYIHKKRICTTSFVLAEAERQGYRVDRILLRIPKYTEATYATALRRTKNDLGVALNDFVVTLKKQKP